MRYIFIILLAACGKQTDYGYLNTDRRALDKYQQWIDHYSKDSSVLGVRTLWAQWYEPRPSVTSHETMKDTAFINCYTDSLEHWYYLMNGTKMFPPTVSRDLRPTRIDTNFNNYNK